MPDLFDAAPDLPSALAAGEEAAAACEEKATGLGWDAAAAERWVLDYLSRHGPTPGEDVVTECAKVHLPHDLRAFGRVFSRLARAGKIRGVGFARRKRGHGSPGIVWEAVNTEGMGHG